MADIEKEKLKFKNFSTISQLELKVKEAIIQKQTGSHDDMTFQIKTLKTAIGIPRVRNQMRFDDFSGLDFNQYL